MLPGRDRMNLVAESWPHRLRTCGRRLRALHRLVARRDRMNLVVEPLVGAQARRRMAFMAQCGSTCRNSGGARNCRHQLDAARLARGTHGLRAMQLRRGQRLTVLRGDQLFARGKRDGARRGRAARDDWPGEWRMAAQDGGLHACVAQAKAGAARRHRR